MIARCKTKQDQATISSEHWQPLAQGQTTPFTHKTRTQTTPLYPLSNQTNPKRNHAAARANKQNETRVEMLWLNRVSNWSQAYVWRQRWRSPGHDGQYQDRPCSIKQPRWLIGKPERTYEGAWLAAYWPTHEPGHPLHQCREIIWTHGHRRTFAATSKLHE